MRDEAGAGRKAVAGRRDFLKLAGLGAAGAAGAAAVPAAATAEVAEVPSRPKGYRETEHVKKVYELARF